MIEQRVVDKFWKYVDKQDACWIWIGNKSHGGDSRLYAAGTSWSVRKLSYEIHIGPLTPGRNVEVSCGQRLCLKPEHLLHGEHELFWSKVDKDGPIPEHLPELGQCWVWTERKAIGGYGATQLVSNEVVAHRASWVMAHNEPLPKMTKILHKCDNPPCVRPDHLMTGTQVENIADRHAKGRDARGERNSGAKLTEAQVRSIRSMLPLERGMYEVLAAQLGVSGTTIRAIAKYRKWKYLV